MTQGVPPSHTPCRSSQQAAQRFEVGRRVEDGSDRDAEARDDAAFDLSGTGLQEQTKSTFFEHVLFDGLSLRIDDPILADAVSFVVLELHASITLLSGWRQDFHDEIRDRKLHRFGS